MSPVTTNVESRSTSLGFQSKEHYQIQLSGSDCPLSKDLRLLTHWGRVTHICVGNLTITGSDNSLSPVRRQAIVWTNAGILQIGLLATIFREICIFSFKKLHLKMSSGKWRPFCLGLNALIHSFGSPPLNIWWWSSKFIQLKTNAIDLAFGLKWQNLFKDRSPTRQETPDQPLQWTRNFCHFIKFSFSSCLRNGVE